MIRRPPRSTQSRSSAASDVYKRQLLARRMGKKKVIAETGAGQHGVATATVAALFGMECKIFMGEEDIRRQAPNVFRMKILGAEVVPVLSGTSTLKDAMNEACATGYPVFVIPFTSLAQQPGHI